MSTQQVGDAKLVRQFRSILIWPLQLRPIREGAQIQSHWELLGRDAPDNPWGEARDAFGCAPGDFKLRHYSEFVTFLPYVRRFLYGDPNSARAKGAESPIRIFRRTDVAKVRMTYPGVADAVTFDVEHVDLCFFYDIDIVILVVEIFAGDLSLTRVQDTMYRFGRAYPTYWEGNRGGHCLDRAEWLSADGRVLAASDYEQRDKYLDTVSRYRAPRFAAHWEFLLKPLVPDHSEQKGVIRYRQIEYSRMPLLTYVAMDDARSLTRADFIRLGLVTSAGSSDALPFSERHVHDFEYRYCFDQFWNEQRSDRPGTRFMSCGHAFAMVGDASEEFYVDCDGGLLGQFQHQYFLLFLIPHFHKAALLMLSDRMVDALNKLDIHDAESVKRFKRTIRQLLEIFLRFTHRYWFHEVSDQPQAKELYRMTADSLGTDRLYAEIREEIEDMSDYLESDTLRRQANAVVRLTVVTVFGMIGTVVTGVFGMNLFAFADYPLPLQVLALSAMIVAVSALLFYTLIKSKRLSDFLEAISDERLPARSKLQSLLNVWRKPQRPAAQGAKARS
ncbi:MAG TPA: CorA family divalent cation transporter [Casimicrobiaceae bacterium]|nr:CorA family divalent cation transporter [Casimicrobiaceae bacterium]